MSRRSQTVAKQYADVTNEHVIQDLVDINFGDDEPAPPLKYSTHARRSSVYAVADLKLLIDVGAVTPYPRAGGVLASEGGLPKPKNPNNPEDQPDEQADHEGDDEPTPPRPTARTRIKTAMTVGERTLRRNPLRHEVKAAADWDAMEDAWSAQQASPSSSERSDVENAHVDAVVEAIAVAARRSVSGAGSRDAGAAGVTRSSGAGRGASQRRLVRPC